MLRSMFSGVSGLRSHQTMMDVIGNNIANVNTVGYKASSAVFTDLLSQVLNGAGVATPEQGGRNPAAVGLGVKLAGISTDFTQGAAQLTGRAMDLSISGDGFFVVQRGGQQLYTRSGSLNFDALGRIVTSDGSIVQGWSADATGAINTNGPVGNLTMPLGQNIAPMETQSVRIGGNLDATPFVGPDPVVVTTSIEIFDSVGTPVNLTMQYTRDASGWTLDVFEPGNDTAIGSFALEFADGSDPAVPIGALIGPSPMTINPTTGSGQWDGDGITIDPGAPTDVGAVTSLSGPNGIQALNQDGYALGSLQSFTIGADGVVTGVFSNGRNRAIGQLAMASFANPVGLEKIGDSMYRASVNSGLAQVGIAGQGGRGTLSGSTLEMSNVDLAREFTNLIVAQRGFQANSRVISASDELLQDLVNLKR